MKVDLVVLLLAYSVTSTSFFEERHYPKDHSMRRYKRAIEDMNPSTGIKWDPVIAKLLLRRQKRSPTEENYEKRDIHDNVFVYFDGKKQDEDTEQWLGGILPAFDGWAHGKNVDSSESQTATNTLTSSTTNLPATTPPNENSPKCFPGHEIWVKEQEDSGCSLASQFAADVCRPFQNCMNNKKTSYWICKPKICEEFKKSNKQDPCMNRLFHC